MSNWKGITRRLLITSPALKVKTKKNTEELAEVPFLILFLHQVVVWRKNVLFAEEFQHVMQILHFLDCGCENDNW